MDRERLNELLDNPARVNEEDLSTLRSMVDRYPWFSGARLLLAAGQHGSSNLLAHEPHHAPAAYIPSRAVLYDLVHRDPPEPAPAMHVVKAEAAPQPVEAAPAAAPPTGPEQDAPHEEPAGLVVAEHPGPPPGTPPPTEPEVAAAPTAAEREREVLDRLFVEAIRSSEYDLEAVAVPPPPPVAPAAPPPAPEPQLPAEPPASHAPAPTAPARPVRLRFTDWLDQDAPPAPGTAPPAEPAAQAPPRAEKPAPPVPAASQQDVLERFIQQSQPAPIAAKAAFFTPQQAAKRSLKDDGLVSETLARIHEKQGNFTKAMEVYDRLAAKHPEKSIYFAALSKALEARVNK